MVDEETDNKNAEVLAQLKEGSEYLENQKEALSRLWEGFCGNVTTFYETGPTKSINKVPRHHTESPVLAPCFVSSVHEDRENSRLTIIAGARMARTGRKRSPNGAAIVRSALFA